jgi:hypothetical protein
MNMNSKIITLTTAVLLVAGMAYAGDKGKEKDKKKEKQKTHTTCSGKECGKKKG